MQARAELRDVREGRHVFGAHVLGMGRHVAQALQAGQGGHFFQQGGKADAVAVRIAAEGVDVLPQQGDLAGAAVQQVTAFVEDGRGQTGLLAAAGIGHDAVGAEIVTALHDVHEAHGRGRRIGAGFALHVMAGEVQQGKTQGGLVQQAFDGLGRAADAVAARHQTHLAAEEFFAQLLGHAAGDGHQHTRRVAGDLADAAQGAHDFLFGLFAHGTGVDHHHAGLFQGRLAKAARFEGAGQPLRVVHVHLAAEGDDVEAVVDHVFYCSGPVMLRG